MKIKFAFLDGGGGGRWGQRGRSSQNAVFIGKRHDNRILNPIILLSRKFVVIAQAPTLLSPFGLRPSQASQSRAAHQGGHATARFLEGFLEGSLTASAS